jgi:hypothetical protein
MTPGRSCPLNYRYTPADLARNAALESDCVYVIGGLYGNAQALDEIDALATQEAVPPTIVFNGDFNWFNADATGFSSINSRVLSNTALRGNVETELASDDPDAGCGCGYPDFVSDTEVERSNRIIERLRVTATGQPALQHRLAALPMYMTALVGAARIAIVHGDCESLAGWGLSHAALAAPAAHVRIGAWFEAARVNVIASSHSCLPVMMDFTTHNGACVVANNGAAGMPNFADTHYGVITRISVRQSPHKPVYGTRLDSVYIDALPVHYDQRRWVADFLDTWPPGSPAHDSYFRRITGGPDYRIETACRLTSHTTAIQRPVTA